MERKMHDEDKTTERARKDAEIEARAADAYERIYRQQNHWKDWMYLADGLMVGRRWALEKAGCQDPVGRGYNEAFSRWMATRPWAAALDKPTRSHLFWCAENRSEIEAWRDELPERERQKKNHPTHMKRAYEAAHKPPKEEGEGEGDEKAEKGMSSAELAMSKELADLRTTVVNMKANPFPWWTGGAAPAAQSLYEDRSDGIKADGKARQLLISLAKEFRARFPNQTAQLLDEVTAILRTPSETVDAAAAKAVDAVAKEGVKAARRVRGAARVAKREAAPKEASREPKIKVPLQWEDTNDGWRVFGDFNGRYELLRKDSGAFNIEYHDFGDDDDTDNVIATFSADSLKAAKRAVISHSRKLSKLSEEPLSPEMAKTMAKIEAERTSTDNKEAGA
jgi:hypothetical protein